MKDRLFSIDEIDLLAYKIANKYREENGGTIGLIGDLGTGKTTITKKICKYLNITETVKSPTFTYVIEYESGDLKVCHFDVYRINNEDELYEIGFYDFLQEENSLIIVEWANNIIDEMPEDTIYIEIKYNDENSRLISTYKINKNGENEYVDIWDNNDNKNS